MLLIHIVSTMDKNKVAVTWGYRQLVEPIASYKSYEVAWLRETALRLLLAHVVGLSDERLSLVDFDLKTIFACALPICATCKSEGA